MKPANDEQREALDRIRRWVEEHPEASFIDPERLSFENEDIALSDLLKAVDLLVRENRVSVKYKAKSPYDRALAEGMFDSPLMEVDVRDNSENLFNTRDAEMVPVFVERSR